MELNPPSQVYPKALAKPAGKPFQKASNVGNPMSDLELQSYHAQALQAAVDFTDAEISFHRAQATDYYLGKPFGNEEAGRSQFVATEVRDSVLGVLPSLLRVFLGSEAMVEYVPRSEKTVPIADQATEFARYVVEEDNPGFLIMHSVMKDGLVRRMGVVKWWWDESNTEQAVRLENITSDQLELLASDPDVELHRIVEDAQEEAEEGEPPAQGTALTMPQMPTYTAEVTVHRRDGICRIACIPPEEFVFSREARDMGDALLVGHRTRKTRGELIALGIDPEVIDLNAGPSNMALKMNVEEIARRDVLSNAFQLDPPAGEANVKIDYFEDYMHVDYDGDGVAELRRICAIGNSRYIVSNDPASERPFALFCPDPEPHTMLGQSWADRTMDLQLFKSSIVRAIADSGALSINPRMGVVEGQVNIQDVLNTEIGSIIRMRQPGMVQPLEVPFIGQQMFPLLQYLDDIREQRTGQNKGVIGLDADALQSSTKGAVQAAVSAAQAQAEMLCRIFAEQVMKPMFRGILRLLVANQPRERMVRLRGTWVPVDPRTWDATMDVSVKVGLGGGLTEEKVATLVGVAAKQEQILQMLGPTNPLVGVGQYRHTLGKILELQGVKDTSNYFAPLPVNWQPPPQPPQPPPPTPEQVTAQAALQLEQMKTQKDMAIKQAQLELDQAKLAYQKAKDDADRALKEAQMATDAVLAREQLEAEYQAKITEAQFAADRKAEELALQATIQAEQAQHDRVMSESKLAHDQMMAEREHQHEQAMSENHSKFHVKQRP